MSSDLEGQSFLFPKMTAAEFRGVVADYASMLPGWKKTKNNAIERIAFPVRQTIWFQRLRTGDYRPTNSVQSIPFKARSILHILLDVKHRECNIRQHPRRWSGISDAMKVQLFPVVSEEIDLKVVLQEARQKANEIANPHPEHRLFEAVIAAWLEQLDEASIACEQAEKFVDWMDRPEPDWLSTIKLQASQLRKSIENKTHREMLISGSEGNP